MEFLEAAGTLLVIILMFGIGINLALRMERLYAKWMHGTTSKKTTVYQWKETYVNFADLNHKVPTIRDSVPQDAATLPVVGMRISLPVSGRINGSDLPTAEKTSPVILPTTRPVGHPVHEAEDGSLLATQCDPRARRC